MSFWGRELPISVYVVKKKRRRNSNGGGFCGGNFDKGQVFARG